MKKAFLVTTTVMFAFMTCMLQADSTPTMSRVYGDQFTPQVADTQPAATIGTLDTTFGSNTGMLSVDAVNSGGQAVGIETLPNGNFLVVVSGAPSKVGCYNAQGVLQTYGTGGIATLGTSDTPRATMLDAQGRLLVAGGAGSGSAGWINRVSTSGTATAFTTGTAWQYVGGLAQQSSGEIIAVGFNGTKAQIARYNLDGSLDTSFGASGFTIFDGLGILPTVATQGLVSVVVDSSDRIYVAFVATATANGFTAGNAYIARFTAAGALDTSWNTTGFAALTDLNSATSGLYVAKNNDGNLIVGAQVGSNCLVTGVTSAGASITGFTTFNTNTINSSHPFTLTNLITTSDDSIFIVGSDTYSADLLMGVIRLIGTTGALDTAFNPTLGYNFFDYPGHSSRSAAYIQAAAITPDGQLYAAGYDINSGTTTPYVSRLNNSPYVSQVAQFPTAQEQGILDQTFGNVATETYPGVMTPFNGLYGSSMMQRAQSIIEVTAGSVTAGDMVVGMNGFTNANAYQQMMLGWLKQDGTLDTTTASGALPASGYLALTPASSTVNEYLNTMVEDGSGNIWIAGYTSSSTSLSVPGDAASTGAILRNYSSFTSGTPAISYNSETGSGYQGVGLALQGSTRTLFCVAESATVGHISGVTSVLDTTFGDAGSGKISSTSYGLHMGPCYGLVVTGYDEIYAAYVNSSVANQVDVAAFVPNGSALSSTFGSAGVVSNLFTVATYTVDPNNVRIGFRETTTEADDIVVAATATAVSGGHQYLLIASLDPITGALSPDFNSGAILAIDTNSLGTTALNLTRVTGISDGTAIPNGKILLTFWDNATDDTMYLARVANDGTLDTTFNSQGTVPGILPIAIGNEVASYNARVATCALVQSTASTGNQGNIVVAGYQSVTANDATPMVMRSYGTTGTTEITGFPVTQNAPGTLDTSFNLGAAPSISAGSGNVVFSYPAGNAQQGKLLIGIDTGTTSKIARVYETNMELDGTFGSGGVYTITGSLTGMSTLSVDAQNNILVGGTTTGGSPASWAQVINNAGSSATSLSIASNVASINQILQQQSGRYIVVGSNNSSNGLIVAYQDKLISLATTFAVDPTFNPLIISGAGAAGNYNLTGATSVYTAAIATDDTIVVAYANGGVVNISMITADGSGIVSGFNSGAAVATTLSTDGASAIRVNIDSTGRIIVGTSYNNGSTHQVQVARYSAAGALDTAGFGSSGIATISDIGSAGVVLTGLMETTTNQTVLVGYNTAGGSGRLFASRLDSRGVEDSTWNSGASLTYAASSAVNVNSGAIAIDGTVLSLGSTASGTSGDPVITLVYGDSYVTQVAQNPLEAAAGTLDSTIPGNASGALALSSLLTGVPQKVYIYNSLAAVTTPTATDVNGAMLIASTDNAKVYITKLNPDLSLASFGTSGVVTITPPGSLSTIIITDLYVANGTNDTTQPIYVTGYTTDTSAAVKPFVYRIAADGLASTVAAPDANFISTGCVRQSSNGRVLVSGKIPLYGAIVAYNSAMTAIDTSFGNGNGTGYYTASTSNPIVAMTTDNSDRIYIAYKNSTSIISVVRLLENGTALDTTFSASFITGTTYSPGQVKMAIDLVNNQLIVGAKDGTGPNNIIQLARFSLADGSGAGNISTITVSGRVLSLSDLFIDNNSTIGGLYPNIYVVGYTDLGNSIVARVASTSSTTIALDTSYGTNGIANLAEGAMNTVTAAALDPDRRVYLVGSNGSANGYMGRFFGDYYWNERYPAILQGVVGSVDLTLSPNNTGGIDLSGQTGWSSLASGYQARAIIENPNGDGSSFIAFGNGTNVIVGKVDADMNPVTSFNTTGLTSALNMTTVNSIMVDAGQNIVVAGTNAGAQKVVIFSSAGSFSANLNTPTIASTVGTVVGQQKSGRYIAGGYDGSANGLVSAYKNPSAISGAALAVDSTFGPAANSGYYATGVNAQIDDLVIDNNDYMYIVYRNSGVVNIAKLTPEGALSTSANSPSAEVWSTNPITSTGITATGPVRIAINDNSNILVGASVSGGVTTQLYNGLTGATIGSALAQTLSNTPILTKLVGAGTEFYGTYYNSATTAGAFVFALDNTGVLDTNFNSGAVLALAGETPLLTDGINGLSVQADGKLVAVGSATGPNPILMRAYGYPYVAQYAQSPNLVAAGILDTTLWPTTGALNLDGYTPLSATITTLNGSSVSRIYEYSNGKALLLFSNTNSGVDCVLARVNKDLTLDTSFNTSGFVTITSQTDASSLFVDSDGNIYVAGGATTSWIRAYSSSGATLSGWSSATSLSAGAYQVGVQSTDRVILSGKNTNGTLYGYNSSGVLDATFGSAGVVNMGSADAITDFAIDHYDNIITVSNNAGSVVLSKVSASGLTTTSLTGGTAISTAVSGSNIKNCLDANGYIIVAAATTTGFIVSSYNNDSTGTNNGSAVTITAGTTSPSWVLSNMYATSDGKITLVGYDASTTSSTAGDVMIARLVSTSGNLTLDTANFNAAGTSPSGAGYLVTAIGTGEFAALDACICADDRIMIAGTQAPDPYLARVFGDTYVSYVSQGRTQGVAGTLNATFGDTTPPTGKYTLSTLDGLLAGAQGKAILPLADGGYYMALDDANTAANSVLVKTLANGALDTSYNNAAGGAIPGIAGSATSPNYAPLGVNGILQDGADNVVLVGTTGGAGWIQRYTSAGVLDTSFNSTGSITLASSTSANVAVEQTLGRLVVAGSNASGAVLYAFKSLAPNGTPGSVDTTFNAGTGGTPGYVQIDSTNGLYNLVADQYDRLIFAVLNTADNAVDLYRLTPTGELDATFGSTGKVAGAISSAAGASSVHVALDAAGHIIVAANSSTTNTFSVAAFDNLSAASGNGAAVYAQLDISSLTGPSVTNLVTSADGYALVMGTQSGTNPAWIARITAGGVLDSSGFNPTGGLIGGVNGIFQYATGGGTTAHVYNALAVNANGTLGMLGYEDSGSTYTPTLVGVYDDPYTSQESQSPDAKAVGSIDFTLGAGSADVVANGITFFGSGSSTTYGQVARALALYNDNNIVVAIDGGNAPSSNSSIFMNMFDNDGILNPNFGTSGQATVLQGGTSPVSPNFQNQYVNDMVTFTTVAGVTKAIVAGYVTNTTLNTTNSLILQYMLTPGSNALDTANFGGFNGSPAGIAFGDGKQINAVGQQSTGRIIASGISQDNLGLLLGYTSAGKLDTSFGNDGYQSVGTGSTGIYSHAIDNQNRVVIAYNDGSNKVAVSRFLADGSAVDSSFNASASYIATISGNSNMKVAVDSSNNVYAAAVVASGNSITVSSYGASNGTQIHTITISGTSLGNGSAVYTMSKLLVDQQGNVIVVAYDSNAEKIVVMRLTSSLVLDTTFNGTGYITYQVAGGSSSQVATDAMIHPDGRIIVVGSQA